MRLVGDIGGTNVRFALADKDGNISDIINYLKTDYNSVADAVNAYRKDCGKDFDEVYLAVNTPIVNGKPFINHHNWGYEVDDFAKTFGVKDVQFFNDLQAHSMSLPFLKEDEKEWIGGGSSSNKGNVVAVGPGTGLGLAYGMYNDELGRHVFYSSEGGNQIAGATDERQIDIIAKIKKTLPSVRFEDICSGRGLRRVYKALFNEDVTNKEITEGLKNKDAKATEVMTIFCEFLGTFIHNVGVAFLPSGGIYIVGGILASKENVEFLKQTDFMDYYYCEKFYNTGYLKDYPIYVVKHNNPALLGLAKAK